MSIVSIGVGDCVVQEGWGGGGYELLVSGIAGFGRDWRSGRKHRGWECEYERGGNLVVSIGGTHHGTQVDAAGSGWVYWVTGRYGGSCLRTRLCGSWIDLVSTVLEREESWCTPSKMPPRRSGIWLNHCGSSKDHVMSS